MTTWLRTLEVDPEVLVEFERAWSALRAGPDECWPWRHNRTKAGYGRFRDRYTHRLAWILANGPISSDKPVVRHTCDNRPCVNPAHLLAGTQLDNIRDMNERGRHVAWKSANTHCPQGHPYADENLIITREGARACRRCHIAAAREARRAAGMRANNRPVCPRGHEFTPENTAPVPGNGRRCKACSREWTREYRARKKARPTA